MEIRNTIEILKKGGIVVYPTETFYAIGCLISFSHSIKKIFQIKKRPYNKPLPVVIGDLSQLWDLTDFKAPIFLKIINIFWPGPLSILVPAKKNISNHLLDTDGHLCVRMTPHPIAKKLCLETNSPIVSTSANLSGKPAVNLPHLLDKSIIKSADYTILSPPYPSGGTPSTIIKILTSNKVKLLRSGAISKKELEKLNFEVV